jgi:hypothetical protein
MNITITSKAINNGKQHILSVPFLGKFTIDQKDVNSAINFIQRNDKNESLQFLLKLSIASMQKQCAEVESRIKKESKALIASH